VDARAKSDLVAAVVGYENKGALHTFTATEAQKLIDARGWGRFVSAKRKAILEKAKANAAKEETAA
jgi:hypothetical protein